MHALGLVIFHAEIALVADAVRESMSASTPACTSFLMSYINIMKEISAMVIPWWVLGSSISTNFEGLWLYILR